MKSGVRKLKPISSPILKLRMCLDILPYKKHDPPLDCNVQKSWVESLGPSKQQVDIVLKTTIADTGAQCFLLGSNHLPGLGLDIEHLIPSEINLNCANQTAAGNLGVFFAKVMAVPQQKSDFWCVTPNFFCWVMAL